MDNIVYRRGDVVRFARGSNEYLGTVVKASKVLPVLVVRPEGDSLAPWQIRLHDVLGLEQPVLTEKERAALATLLKEAWPVTLRTLNGIATGEAVVSGTTMRGLAARGLAVGEREGVMASRALEWRLTEEGDRVARSL